MTPCGAAGCGRTGLLGYVFGGPDRAGFLVVASYKAAFPDVGATASFQARFPGTALLETSGYCAQVSPQAASEFGTCSILAVTVVP